MTPDDLTERLLEFAVRVGKVVKRAAANTARTPHCRAVGAVWDVAGTELPEKVDRRKPR